MVSNQPATETEGSSTPQPHMLRVYKDDRKGATAFFRNRPFLNTVLGLLQKETDTPSTFFHACSIGAEPYSFAAFAKMMMLDVSIDATDIEPEFMAYAEKGVYPANVLRGMTTEEKYWFTKQKGNNVLLRDEIRRKVKFQPASSVTQPIDKQYDAVFAMNVLTYLSPDDQTLAIVNMAKSARKFMCVTAFHPDQIKSDMEFAGFEPVEKNQEEIHNAWGDRIREGGAEAGTPAYSWVIPPYNTDAPDYNWRYCAIFKRRS